MDFFEYKFQAVLRRETCLNQIEKKLLFCVRRQNDTVQHMHYDLKGIRQNYLMFKVTSYLSKVKSMLKCRCY